MTMKWTIFCGICALAALPLSQANEPGSGDSKALLNKVISHPGSYSQVCDVMSAPQDIPYRAFVLNDFWGGQISKTNEASIKADRDGLVKAIRARLLEIDLNRPAKQPAEDPAPEVNNDGETYGCDPLSLNPILLGLIERLSAIETLPELLAIEQKLVEGIAKAKDDAKAAPPVVSGWFVAQENAAYDENEAEAKRDRRNNLFQARVAQRDLVMIMSLLMREKKYAPYLETKLEKAYVKGIKANVKTHKLPTLAEGETLPEEVDGWEVDVDPVTGLVRRAYSPVLVPYSRESRDEVRAAAQKWISEH